MTTLVVILVVVGIGLVAVDLFFRTELVAGAGWCVAAAGGAIALPGDGWWNLFEWFSLAVLGGVLQWRVLRRVVETWVDEVHAPDRFHAGARGLAGKRGRVRRVEEQWFVEVGGDLWPLEDAGGFEDGCEVVIETARGTLRLRAAGG